tara:strand:- start:59 stop:259 length:201 start_codon:yes stop_codon:yes gene_type:complete
MGRTMEGLKVKNGRLINDRPEPVIGLYEMARAKKARKRADKVAMIAEGNAVGEAIEMMRSSMPKRK